VFLEANRKAAGALTDYAALARTRTKLPKATTDFALGQEKFQRPFEGNRTCRSSARKKILEIGLTQLRKEQKKRSPTPPRGSTQTNRAGGSFSN